MTPTEELRHEHDIILVVLNAADRQAGVEVPDPKTVTEMVDFFMNFVDRCHHAKEEKYLFPRLEARGVARSGGPIGVMLDEHTNGRRLVAEMKRMVLPDAVERTTLNIDLQSALRDYAALLRAHIDKENGVLFPLADRLLSREDQDMLHAAFERVEAEEIGEGVHEKYHQMAHRLADGSDHS